MTATAQLPVLPYNGHSSGPSASFEARVYADTHGITRDAQRAALDLLGNAHARGLTVNEMGEIRPDLHKGGKLSGALSDLHLDGHLALLAEKRNRCHVYVLPQYVNDRPTVAHKSNRPKQVVVEKTLETFTLDADTHVLTYGGVEYVPRLEANEKQAMAVRAAIDLIRETGQVEGLSATVALLRSTHHRLNSTQRSVIGYTITNLEALIRDLHKAREAREHPFAVDAWKKALESVAHDRSGG